MVQLNSFNGNYPQALRKTLPVFVVTFSGLAEVRHLRSQSNCFPSGPLELRGKSMGVWGKSTKESPVKKWWAPARLASLDVSAI